MSVRSKSAAIGALLVLSLVMGLFALGASGTPLKLLNVGIVIILVVILVLYGQLAADAKTLSQNPLVQVLSKANSLYNEQL